jgi:hypothetical protein
MGPSGGFFVPGHLAEHPQRAIKFLYFTFWDFFFVVWLVEKEKKMGKLKLEWIEAGSLADNPANWRQHSPEQLDAIRDLTNDPEIGWAGACLYNKRTKRLIDGHARKSVSDPKTPIPVLVGDWSEEAEKKILATLDPVGAMATGDPDAYAKLIEGMTADSLALRELLAITAAGTGSSEELNSNESAEKQAGILPEMELRPFEHYDYVLVLARTTTDWEMLAELLELKKVNCSPIVGKVKVGLGRAVDASKLIKIIKGEK